MLAPALREGAKMPPAAPVVNDRIGPTIRTIGRYQLTDLWSVNRVEIMSSFPEPNAPLSRNIAVAANIKPHMITYNIL